MSHPGLFPGGSRTPQRLRRFVLVEEWMVAGCRQCRHPATIHSSTSKPLRGEQCGHRSLQNNPG